MRKIWFTLLFLSLGFTYAQGQRKVCGSYEYMQKQLQDPAIRARYEQVEAKSNESMQNAGSNKTSGTVYVIPCVFHVVWNQPAENIPDAMITSQIDVLNEDYRAMNADTSVVPGPFKALIGDAEIMFCLATKDPQGNPTSGILRVQTTQTSFGTDDLIKSSATGGSDPWPSDQYMNFWVGNLGGGLLGYAQFPGGPAATDGVVCTYQSTGRVSPGAPYDLGRTATHEVGHWLGMRHIWGDDGGACNNAGDGIADTPDQADANFGCITFPTVSCSGSAPNGDLFVNYMDYGDDRCLVMFSKDQCTKMRTYFDPGQPRATLPNGIPTICSTVIPSPGAQVDGAVSLLSPEGDLCGNTLVPTFTFTNTGDTLIGTFTITYQVTGGTPQTYTWNGSLDTLLSTVVTLPAITAGLGAQQITVTITGVNGGADGVASNNSITSNINVLSVSGANPPLLEGFEGSTFPPTYFTVNNAAGVTWEQTSLAARNGLKSIRIRNNTNPVGAIDDLHIDGFSISGSTVPSLSFAVAYAPYTTGASDTLEVLISTDCGASFFQIAEYYGNSLYTASATTNPFVPANWSQWKYKQIDLSPYGGNPSVEFIFRNHSSYENNLYLDDINIIATPVSITQGSDLSNSCKVYPNPAKDKLNVLANLQKSSNVSVQLLDMTGKSILSQSEWVSEGAHAWILDISSLARGVYLIQISDENSAYYEKVVIE